MLGEQRSRSQHAGAGLPAGVCADGALGEPPRLTSLRVSGVPEPQCQPSCPALALTPAFSSDVSDYRVTAPADIAQVTVSYTAAGGEAVVDPVDAEPPPAEGPDASPGHQVALGGPQFAAVDARAHQPAPVQAQHGRHRTVIAPTAPSDPSPDGGPAGPAAGQGNGVGHASD